MPTTRAEEQDSSCQPVDYSFSGATTVRLSSADRSILSGKD